MAEREHGSGRMGTHACRGGREEVVVFEPAPVFSVELSGGAGETWFWHLKHLSLPSAALHCLASLGSWWAGAGKGGLF